MERINMVRVGKRARLKAGCKEDYRQIHKEVWPEVISLIKKAGVRN